MQPHTKIYLTHFGYSENEYIPCEVCQCQAVDIHHIVPRSKFGKNTKNIQDSIDNLIALCRDCHTLAHDEILIKEMLILVHKKWLRNKANNIINTI